MTNSAMPPSEALHLDLLDIQKNLNALVRQLKRQPRAPYPPQVTATLMAAMAYKLAQLSHRVTHH